MNRQETKEKRNTKNELAKSFKLLLEKIPMEKLTVQEITDLTGVIRPTFYNHFSDKYELLEYIIRNDLLMPIKPLLVNGMIIEGLTLLFTNMKNERKFYENAIKIEGQNSFESIARQEVSRLLVQVIEEQEGAWRPRHVWLTSDIIAEYYAQSMVYIAITWIKREFIVTPKELSEIYDQLTRCSMLDIIKEYA